MRFFLMLIRKITGYYILKIFTQRFSEKNEIQRGGNYSF